MDGTGNESDGEVWPRALLSVLLCGIGMAAGGLAFGPWGALGAGGLGAALPWASHWWDGLGGFFDLLNILGEL